jgi:hypothetical protein
MGQETSQTASAAGRRKYYRAHGQDRAISRHLFGAVVALLARAIRYSPLSVLRENVVAVLHHRVAREPALRIVPAGDGPLQWRA